MSLRDSMTRFEGGMLERGDAVMQVLGLRVMWMTEVEVVRGENILVPLPYYGLLYKQVMVGYYADEEYHCRGGFYNRMDEGERCAWCLRC